MSGKYIVNSFQTPNAIIDDLMPLLTDSEFRVLMFMTRQILGWSSSAVTKRARIAQSIIANGYTYTDSEGNDQTKLGCGVKKGAIKAALKSLQEYRIIKAIGKPTNDGQMWELILLTKSNPDVRALELRADTKTEKLKIQTSKARKINPKNQGGTVQQIHPRGDCSTDTQGDCSTDTNETQETQETHVKGLQTPKTNFMIVREQVVKLGLINTSTDNDLFKSDFDEYTIEQWEKGIDTFNERRKEKGKFLPYKYLASIVRGLMNESKQAALIESQKPPKMVIVPPIEIKRPSVTDGMVGYDASSIEGGSA